MKKLTKEEVMLNLKTDKMNNPQTMLIGENWYYWNESKKQWLPESYKFEETK